MDRAEQYFRVAGQRKLDIGAQIEKGCGRGAWRMFQKEGSASSKVQSGKGGTERNPE